MIVPPGTEGLFVQGLIKSVMVQDLIAGEATQPYPQAFVALQHALDSVSLEHISDQTGVTVEHIHEAAQIFAEADRSIILCGEGILRQPGGYYHVLNLIDLAWVTGKLGKPGCGINTLTEEANEQGALDMGVAPEFLPGPVLIDHPEARERFSQEWDSPLPTPGHGADLMEILKRCRSGDIKALYLVGENPLATLPASCEVEAALSNLEVLICQDPFLTETGQLAHVVLPACTFAEKDGTMTNQEGQVQYVRPGLDPIGESAMDWHIMAGIANSLGFSMDFDSTHDVQMEIRKLLPGYYNLGRPKTIQPNLGDYFTNGYVGEVASRYTPSAKEEASGRFRLKMIQLLYHSGKLSTRASGLTAISPNTMTLRMAPEDLEQKGIQTGDRVRITSDQGSLEFTVEGDVSLLHGSCTVPEHFNEPSVKDLMPLYVDPDTGVPYFKMAHVTVEKL
jgi:formate dehydrogenase alpha subunit